MFQSLFRPYAIGTVVEDKLADSFMVKCALTEIFYQQEGRSDSIEKISDTIKDKNGKLNAIDVESSIVIRAKWLAISSDNRDTAPDLKVGETVRIYRYADTTQFFWEDMFNETNIRRYEHVVHRYVNTNIFGEKVDDTNSYRQIFSTRDKYVEIITTDNDGEETTYSFKIDTKEGTVTLLDGKENSTVLNSRENSYQITTNELVGIKTKHTVVESEEDVTVTTKITKVVSTDLVETTTEKNQINANKFGVFGNNEEIISLMLDFLDAAINEQHVGNLMIPTYLMPSSKAQYEDIKSRLTPFKI